MLFLQTDLLYYSVNLLQVPVFYNLPNWSAKLLRVRPSLLPVPMRCYHINFIRMVSQITASGSHSLTVPGKMPYLSLLDTSPFLLLVRGNQLPVPVRCMPALQSTRPVSQHTASHSQSSNGSSKMPSLQSTRLVSKKPSSLTPTGKKVLSTVLFAGASAASQEPDSDLDQQISPAHPMEEEGKISD